ncbi:hypothetical protein OH76DRAFT_909978 [Lentinus brumalis]|uniref:Granulins domain-containing protein n=1 Tax=Lentinus brumalis TaxID=2498619 RepID=A0A371D0P2_9APHY|nr:hypothetical protein OH76DRAFT_909978 [Polyporus brumalis]
MSYTRTLALFVVSTLLLLPGALAANLNGRGPAPGPHGGITSSLTRRQSEDDGCPSGWTSCSETTCYPLDGSQCCADGTYCDPGFTCQETVTGTGCLDASASGHSGALAHGPVGSAALFGLLGVAAVYMA